MCRLITATVPAKMDLQASKPLFDRFEMSFEEIKNPFIEKQINGGRYVRATHGHCDCNSALGSAANQRSHSVDEQTSESEIEKLKRKGWSKTKIDRWCAEKLKVQQKDNSKLHAELKLWREFLTELFDSEAAEKVGLLIHMYRGGLEHEQFQINRTEKLRMTSKFEDALLAMDEDVLYLISKS